MAVFKYSRVRQYSAVVGPVALLAALWAVERFTSPVNPSFVEVQKKNQGSFSVVYDRTGKVLDIQRRQFDVQQLPWQALEKFSEIDVKTILANEDKRFYSHSGVDLKAMVSVVGSVLQGKLERGGSTISMQVARLVAPKDSMPRSFWGKWQQMRAAWALERNWSKIEILEIYLNLLPMRGEVVGLHTAKKLWMSDQSITSPELQAVMLTAMIPSPQAALPSIAKRACRLIVGHKQPQSCDDVKKAVEMHFQQVAASDTLWPKRAPHAARRVMQQAGEFHSSLDAGIQEMTQTALNTLLIDLYEANVRDAAAVVLDNATGEVLAYVGSAGRFSKSPHVDGALAMRQPASTIKPFIYALAFDAGKLSITDKLSTRERYFAPLRLEDVAFKPRHEGPNPAAWVTPREALGGSMNIPAVLVLERLGLEQGQKGLLAFGLANTKTVNQTGLALALGSHEVGLAHLTNAYRTLANGGIHGALKWTTKVGDQAVPTRIISETSAKTVNSILSDFAPRNRAFGEFNALNTSFASMSKTGTSNGAHDNWALGSTARHTVGVWIGNFEHDAMRDIYGPAGAGLAWRVIMENLHRLP